MLVVAFDPGLTGACAVLDHTGLRAVFDLPTMDDPTAGEKTLVRRKIDCRALVRLLRDHCPPQDGRPFSLIEAVTVTGPQHGHGVQSQGSLQRTFGAVEAVLECLGWAPEYVRPQAWKKFYGLIKADQTDSQRKRASLEMARRLYPTCADIALAKHHNRAESILLAHYGRRTMS